MTPQRPDDFLPLKPATFLVLVVLAAEELHGYGIKKEVRERTAGRIDMEPGMLYRLMARLTSQGLIAEAERRQVDAQGDERRRYYRITGFGRDVVEAEAARMVQLADSKDVRDLAHASRS